LWHFDSATGSFRIEHFSGWPNPPRRYYRVAVPDPYNTATPVFAFSIGGAARREWQRGDFRFARGTVCVVLKPDGSADFGSPALPVLETLMTAKLSPPLPFWMIDAPYWVPVGLLLVLPVVRVSALFAGAVLSHIRRSRSLCEACGYDLRATPDRSPECGAVPPSAQAVRS
jgi:hypothetical protein